MDNFVFLPIVIFLGIFVVIFISIVIFGAVRSKKSETLEISNKIKKSINNTQKETNKSACSYCGGTYEGDKCPYCGARK